MTWAFLSGRYLAKLEAALSRPLSDAERQAFGEDAHGGWWETSLMLLMRPDLVDEGYRGLPPARYPLRERLVPNYPLKNGGQGYVGHPALVDSAFAKATLEVLTAEAMELVDGLLDGRLRPSALRSPFYAIPFSRTNFWPVAGAAACAGLLAALWRRR